MPWGSCLSRRGVARASLALVTALRVGSQDRIGVHVLTGPVFVRGAAPGDVLRVDVLEVA